MARTLKEVLAELPETRRKAILDRADELHAEVMTLAELRKKLLGSQAKLGKRMGIKQAAVSRIEGRPDILLSTLRQFIDAMGGKIRILAQFANRPSVSVTLLDVLDMSNRPAIASAVTSTKFSKSKTKIPTKKIASRGRVTATTAKIVAKPSPKVRKRPVK